MATGIVSLGQFETRFRVGGRPRFVGRRRSVIRGAQLSPVRALGRLGQEEEEEETSAERDRLVETLAVLAGEEKAEQVVSDLEVVVQRNASRAATDATKRVVHRGLLISAGLSALTVLGTFIASR